MFRIHLRSAHKQRTRILAFGILSAIASLAHAQSEVQLVKQGNNWQLLRGGEPYAIRGAAGNAKLSLLAAAGGNSTRTWGADEIGKVLDEADKHGLTVSVGMWLGHERHGFDYQDEAAVVKQMEECLEVVRKHKDHPAVLLWAIGNEMEGDGTRPAVWHAVNQIAQRIKQIDSAHPTMTVIAELGEGESKLHSIAQFCPSIDIVGINSYGGIATLGERYRASGIKKPYIVTEHGPNGPWEVGKTRWGTPIEATSTAKGAAYRTGYQKAVQDQPGHCLGSYAFTWGHKQETTATWFGMLLPDGSRLAAADAMTEAWTNTPPKNRCPRIDAIKVDRTDYLKPGSKISATLTASDPEGDSLDIQWILRQDTGTIGAGGDHQEEEAEFADAVDAAGATATITVPDVKGGLRLFVYLRDGKDGAATANIPLFVGELVNPIASPKAKLPLVVYADGADAPYAASGYMGNVSAVSMKPDCTDNPRSGATCLKIDYSASNQWGGVLWQSPANDWDGSLPGGFDLTEAAALEFYARGAAGGERVSFVLGVVETANPYRDSAKAELKDVQLTKEWQKHRIPLNGLDLSRIKTGFGWSAAGQGDPITFYVDDVRYVAE